MTKPRVDGKGDGWAMAHRESLGGWAHMSDLDAVAGMIAFAQNTAESLFIEYQVDRYERRMSRIREFGLVAMFDRKASLAYADSDSNLLATAVYLDLCRAKASRQPVPPRFFWVIGSQVPPWTMIELDINTGEKIGSSVILNAPVDWDRVWEALGLKRLREELRRWTHSTVVQP